MEEYYDYLENCSNTPQQPRTTTSFLYRFKADMKKLRPVPPTPHGHHQFHVPKTLKDCSQDLVWNGAHHSLLQKHCDGPFRVISRHKKFFTVDLNTRVDKMTFDRLKLAFVDGEPHQGNDANQPIPAHLQIGTTDNLLIVEPSCPNSSQLQTSHEDATSTYQLDSNDLAQFLTGRKVVWQSHTILCCSTPIITLLTHFTLFSYMF